MTVPAVYAQIDSCDYDRETNMAQVSGRVKADTAVSLRVKRDNNIVYEDQVNSDAEGVYTHAFKVSGQEGDYIVTVGVTGIKTPYETTLHFYGDLGGLLDEINEISKSGSADNMKEKLGEESENLLKGFENKNVFPESLIITGKLTNLKKVENLAPNMEGIKKVYSNINSKYLLNYYLQFQVLVLNQLKTNIHHMLLLIF